MQLYFCLALEPQVFLFKVETNQKREKLVPSQRSILTSSTDPYDWNWELLRLQLTCNRVLIFWFVYCRDVLPWVFCWVWIRSWIGSKRLILITSSRTMYLAFESIPNSYRYPSAISWGDFVYHHVCYFWYSEDRCKQLVPSFAYTEEIELTTVFCGPKSLTSLLGIPV